MIREAGWRLVFVGLTDREEMLKAIHACKGESGGLAQQKCVGTAVCPVKNDLQGV